MKVVKGFFVVAALSLIAQQAHTLLLRRKAYLKMSSLVPQDSNCNPNETLVVYREPVIKKGKLFPSLKARCCPGAPQIEPHRIVGEICPLMSGGGNFSLPEGFKWAPLNDTTCPQNFSRPLCCLDPSAGFCYISHDRTSDGSICPIGRFVCCPRLSASVFTKDTGLPFGCSQEGFLPGVKKTQRLLKSWMTKDWNEKSKLFPKRPQHKKLFDSSIE